jgi:enterochelin esterase-like enzyme
MEALNGLWSPQLIALQQQLQQGNNAALITFREKLIEQGTPLVEPFDEKQFLVTLLWLDLEGTRVPGELTCALGGILNSRKMAFPLFHLENSDLWYRTYRLPSNVRATYHFFINGEPVSDPLSQNVLLVPPAPVSVYGEKKMLLAIVELPDSTPEHWSLQRAGVPRGNVQTQLMHSSIVGHDYRLSIYTPPGYQTNRAPYPLLLLYDEWTYTHVIPTPIILDNMLANGLIPPLVAVLFGHIRREERMREMGFYEPFFTCVTQELLPWIYERYHVTRDPAQTTIAGASMGGIAAVYSALRYPEHFGKVYSHTGSFQAGPPAERAYQHLERELMNMQHSVAPLRFYLDVGMLERDEMGYGSPDGGPNALESNRMLRDMLHAKGYEVTYVEYPGAHDLLWAPATLVDALKILQPANK